MNLATRTLSTLSLAAFLGFAALAASPSPNSPAAEPPQDAKSPESHDNTRGGTVRFDPASPAALQVKKLKSGHLLVRPTINGHDAGWFIFDTGAGICCISTPQVAGLELDSAGDVESTGVGGSQTSKVYNAKMLTLGPATFEHHPLMAVDLAFLEPLIGEKICGVIGYGVLDKCIFEIDLAAPGISLFDPAKYALSRGEWTTLDLSSRVPVVPGSFESHDAMFRLDLGATGSVTFHQPTVAKYDLLKGRDLGDCKLGGVGGFVPGKRGTVSSLKLGNINFENLPAEFALEAKGSFAEAAIDGNIGTDLLKRFLLVTDYPGKRVALLAKEESPAK